MISKELETLLKQMLERINAVEQKVDSALNERASSPTECDPSAAAAEWMKQNPDSMVKLALFTSKGNSNVYSSGSGYPTTKYVEWSQVQDPKNWDVKESKD